jgi:hypothetical protein
MSSAVFNVISMVIVFIRCMETTGFAHRFAVDSYEKGFKWMLILLIMIYFSQLRTLMALFVDRL